MSLRRRSSFALVLLTSAAVGSSLLAQGRGGGPGGPPQTQPASGPHFEYVGPTSAGRISAAAAVTGAPGVYYAEVHDQGELLDTGFVVRRAQSVSV